MNFDVEIERMKVAVKAAEDEAVMAVMFHETWKPTAYDEDLHERMGESYATQAFLIVRASLRRETLLALMRLWDTHEKAIGVQSIVRTLRDQQFFDALIASRTDHLEGFLRLTLEEHLQGTLGEQLAKAEALVYKYTKGGACFDTFRKLLILRGGRLAHRQAAPAKAVGLDATDQEIGSFYQDNLEIVRLLLSIRLRQQWRRNPKRSRSLGVLFFVQLFLIAFDLNGRGLPNQGLAWHEIQAFAHASNMVRMPNQ